MAQVSRITDRDDWFDIWYADRQSMVDIMVSNMVSDLSNGYDYFDACMVKQRRDIESYKKDTNRTLDLFKTMDEKAVNRWCFYDMKKRGVIE